MKSYNCKYCDTSFTTRNHMVMHECCCPYIGVKKGYKLCKTCGKERLLKEFNKNKSRYDNLNGQCKECTKKYVNSWLSDTFTEDFSSY